MHMWSSLYFSIEWFKVLLKPTLASLRQKEFTWKDISNLLKKYKKDLNYTSEVQEPQQFQTHENKSFLTYCAIFVAQQLTTPGSFVFFFKIPHSWVKKI